MFYRIFSLELKRNLKSPSFYIFFLIFFGSAMVFTLTTDPYSQFMGIAHGKEWHNAPIVIAQIMTRLGVIGLLFTMIMIGRAVAKDYEANSHELIFSRPISKWDYLGGRFAGSFVANLLLFVSIILSFQIGIAILGPEYSGSFQFGTYLLPIILLIIPNLLLIGGVLFALATLTRKMTSTYLAGIAFLAIYAIIGVMLHRMDNETLKVLLDPFGITALTVYSKFWTVSDMNQNLIPVNTIFLFNRLIWTLVATFILVYTYRRFKFISFLEAKRKKLTIVSEKTELIDYKLEAPVISVQTTKLFTFTQCLSVSWREFKRIIFHPAFLILTFLAISQILTNFLGQLGNSSGYMYPFTSAYIGQTMHIWMYMMPITIFFGGMLVWKEKDYNTDEIMNSLPIPNWFSYVNKLLTLIGIYILYLGLTIISGVVTQVFFLDFYDIELGLYFKQFFGIDLLKYIHMAIIVLFIQNLSPNKYVGFFLSALYFVLDLIIFDFLKADNILLRYGHIPEYIYSNINGFGHYGQGILWYSIYWLLFGAIIAWLTILLWRRSNENSVRVRIKNLKSNITRDQISGLSILLILFVIGGLFIGYNKYILNPYMSEKEEYQMRADYEKKYSKYASVNQPTIVDINLNVDIFPKERTVNVDGEYVLYNNTSEPVEEVYINLNDWNLSNLELLQFDRPFNKKLHANEFGFRILELEYPMQPGETMNFTFKYDIIAEGFSENQPKNEIVENGTCLMLSSFTSTYFPLIGYNVNMEILKNNKREKYNLPAKADAPSLEDADPTRCVVELSRPNYEAVLSTLSDQMVISPGHLLEKWEKEGRNYFHYTTDTIIENEIVIVSGRFDVAREHHHGVNVEVYFHPKHGYNIGRIMDGLKDSYDYGNKYFSEYPYQDLRIVEVPKYMKVGAARHFPTTFIWSESEGFVTRYAEGDIDIVYGIAAHENAHHWWAGIVTPAFAEGAFMFTETMTQYVMAMLTEKKYGKEISRKYLKREMDSYLVRRKTDAEGERPLLSSSVAQSYIGYKKSTAVMYALQDYIGEDSVGMALHRIVDKFGYRLDTFALASDLINEFYKVTPDSLKYLINDLFMEITLYENRINKATWEKQDDGKFLITLDVETAKFYADSVGNQTEASLNDYIYIALLDEEGEDFYYQKHLFTDNNSTITLITDKIPAKAGIDPYFVLIDRGMEDNECEVTEVSWELQTVAHLGSFILND